MADVVLHRRYGRFLGSDLADRFNFMGGSFSSCCPRPPWSDDRDDTRVLVHRRNRGRLGHPEARADSPQIVRGRELLPEIIRFACLATSIPTYAVSCCHEGSLRHPRNPGRNGAPFLNVTALSFERTLQSDTIGHVTRYGPHEKRLVEK